MFVLISFVYYIVNIDTHKKFIPCLHYQSCLTLKAQKQILLRGLLFVYPLIALLFYH